MEVYDKKINSMLAKKCGADAIKFQSFNPDKVATKKLKLVNYQKKKKSRLEK